MSDAGHRGYVEGWRQRRLGEEEHLRRVAARNMEAAEKLARILVDRYGVRGVYLFGSLARGNGLHESSDLDLAVEGLPADRYFQALADLWQLLPPGLELDLVPLELASSEMVDVVRSEGILLCAAA